jgi:ligand-binding sensor domain-containing protein
MKTFFWGLLCSLFYLLPLWQTSVVNAQISSIQAYFPSDAMSPATKYVFAKNEEGQLWAANEKAELFHFDNEDWIGVEIDHELNSAIRAVQFDGSGRLWLGTQFQGIFVRSGDTWIRYHTMNTGISSNNIFDIVFDGMGTTWVNHGAFGLSMWNGAEWNTYSSENGAIPEGMITAVTSDEMGRLWAGVGSHLIKYLKNDWYWMDLDELYDLEGTVISNLRWIDDQLLISTNKGLFIQDSEGEITWASMDMGEILITDAVVTGNQSYCFAEAGYGLHFMEGEIVTSIFGNTSNQVPHLILDMEITEDGTIWLSDGMGGIKAALPIFTTTREEKIHTVSFFPNPSDGKFNLKDNVCSTNDHFELWVYDALGQLMAFREDVTEIDLGFLPSAWYRVIIRSPKQQEVWIGDLLIQH